MSGIELVIEEKKDDAIDRQKVFFYIFLKGLVQL